ncbi:LuxR C-terminal-related transcriptional regulator [Nocardioidaceae bacterium SCSIO 66511]|nr:LuxR C-terminal-related transcriptional regulator [Nocardioidaceae bacterium SCSIO 66511]
MIRLLDGARPGELLLVAAPAGWGKTTAVSQWAASGDRPVAWVDCNAALGEPDALWEVIRTSLTDALGTDLPSVPQPSLPVDRPILHHVLSPLLSTRSDVVLVLDDLHVLDDPAVLDDLKALVAHPPASLLLVLVTRADPLLALYRARAAGILTEVRADDLAFTAEETRLLVEQRGIALPGVREISEIRDRMEGWATGLGLALSSLANAEGSAASSDVGPRAGPLLTGYLVEQVLDRLDPADRRMLMQLSVVDRFDVTLAERLTGAPVSLARLDGLAQVGGFLTSDPLESLPFRIHGLLRTVLRDELRIADGSLVRAVNVGAAEWYRSVDLIGPAIDCALEARDWDLAADLLVDLASLGMANGPLSAAARYLERFRTGRTTIDPRPVLVDVALSLDRGDLDGSAARLAMTAEAIESLPTASRVRADLLRRLLAAGIEYLRGDGQRLLTALGPDEDFAVVGDRHAPWSSADAARRACARSLQAYGELHLGRLAAADRTANEAMGAAGSDFALVEVHTRQVNAAIAVARGDLRRALELSGEAKRLSSRRAGALIDTPLANAVAAWSLLERGDFAGASAEIDAARTVGGQARLVDQVGGYLMEVIETRLDAANGQDPTSVVNDVRNITERRPSTQYPYLFKTMRLATTVHALLAMGAHTDALEVIESGPIAAGDDNAALARATVVARTAVFDPAAVTDEEMGRLRETVSSLERELHADTYSGWAVRLLLAAAVIESREDHHDRASVLLHRALAETEQQGWRLPYLELGGAVGSLLSRERLRISAYSSLIGDLLHDLDQPMEEPRADLVIALSKREIEILRVLPAGCDQDELARQLFISKNTLKTHLRAIYRKLGVESRRQAVLRGERLHLL